MIVIGGRVPIKPEHRDEAIELWQKMTAASQIEKGCISCHFYFDPGDPNTLLIFQEWETREDFRRHSQTDPVLEIRRQLPRILASEMRYWRYEAPTKQRVIH